MTRIARTRVPSRRPPAKTKPSITRSAPRAAISTPGPRSGVDHEDHTGRAVLLERRQQFAHLILAHDDKDVVVEVVRIEAIDCRHAGHAPDSVERVLDLDAPLLQLPASPGTDQHGHVETGAGAVPHRDRRRRRRPRRECEAIRCSWESPHSAEGVLDGTLPRLLDEFGKGLAAFYQDLGSLTNQLTLVTMSEFGRRCYENGSEGTDHGHGNMMFIMGGGIKGGKVYGKWPGLAKDQLYGPGDLNITTDFRDVLAEIVQNRMNNPKIDQVFPDYKPQMLGLTKTT